MTDEHITASAASYAAVQLADHARHGFLMGPVSFFIGENGSEKCQRYFPMTRIVNDPGITGA